MTSFGISLSLKSKRSLSLIRSLQGHRYQIYRPKSHSQSHHHHLAVGDTVTLARALTIATNWKSYLLGTQVHGCVFKLGFSNDTFSQNNLIKMYSECGVLCDGLKVFGEMPKRNLISWTLIISSAVRNGEFETSLEVYVEMTRAGLLPNEFALGSVLKASTSMGNDANRLGLCVHCFALKAGMESNLFVGSSLLHLYAKCGIIEAAERVFEDMDYHDVGCWNAMVGGYVQCGLCFEAVRTVSLMKRDGKLMDNITFINALKGCLTMGGLEFGRQIHGIIVKSKIEQSTSLVNALMDMYFKNAKEGTAFRLFNVMQKRDVVSWNTLFAGLSPDVEAREVATLFSNFMLTNLKPNHLTFSILFRLCSDVHQLNLGLQFLSLAFQFGFYGEAHVASSLINMLSRCGAIKMARLAFDGVPLKNIYNWNELISGYNLICDTEALKVFCQLRRLGIEANECTFSCALEACFWTENLQVGRQIHGIIVKYGFSSHGYICSSLIKGYVKLGLLADAFKFLGELEQWDMVLWSTLISASVHQGFTSEAIKFLNCLKEVGGKPDEFMLGSILNGCAVNASHHQTKSAHSLIIKTGYDTNAFVASAVIDAYAKYGDIESARIAFDYSSKYNDIVLCNTMIMAYANHGMVVEAIELFEKIKLANLKPSQATFVSIMSACNHIGLVDQGRALFKSMTLDYGMEPLPDNYGCLVDLLSRNGYLQDAKDIIEQMPLKPWPAIWRSLLNGCRIHGDRELGEQVARELMQLAPENDAAYVFLLKVYFEDGNWDDAAKVREQMMERGLRKSPGFSWVEI